MTRGLWRHLGRAAVLAAMLALPAGAQTGPVIGERGKGGAIESQEPGTGPGAAALDVARSVLTVQKRGRDRPGPLSLTLGLTRAVPYRVALIDGPPRLIVDLEGTEMPPPDAMIAGAGQVPALRWGAAGQPGWGRVVVELPGPMRLDTARLRLGDAPALDLRLWPVAPEEFAPRADRLAVLRGLPQPAAPAPQPSTGAEGPLRVVIDPGHGGIDPGAQVGAISEAAVMLGFARDLAQALRQAGIEPVLTRDDDRFVPLERRTTIARAMGADLFVSLHADALPAGEAAGATIYTWDPESNDRAAGQLAARHDRDDMLAGIDLADTDEAVTRALIDLARLDTQPRSVEFARRLTARLSAAGIGMHRVPVRGAAFSVLKSPDIPSVLIELGFLTDPADRANLFDPEWRAGVARAIAGAVGEWAGEGPGPAAPPR